MLRLKTKMGNLVPRSLIQGAAPITDEERSHQQENRQNQPTCTNSCIEIRAWHLPVYEIHTERARDRLIGEKGALFIFPPITELANKVISSLELRSA